MSNEMAEQVRAWLQVIIPVVLAAMAQVAVTISQVGAIDKSLAVTNAQLSHALETAKNAETKIASLTERVSRLASSEERVGEVRIRIEAIDARLTALSTQLNLAETRFEKTREGKK
jgi:uncharacterized membrane protein